MSPQVELSLLDRSRIRAGEPDVAALRHTVKRAERVERLGYHRFWVAEHRAVPGIASGSPPVLMAAVAARTGSIRVGSGGVMLPNHQPLVVAEQFAMPEDELLVSTSTFDHAALAESDARLARLLSVG
ncbi:hypothetical protein GCM10009609_09960 [Pseudonocardia aurantiaca]